MGLGTSALKEYKLELIGMFVILFLLILLRIYPNYSLSFHIGILSLLLFIASSIEGILVSKIIIGLMKKKLRLNKAVRGGHEFRPLEFFFFIFIFLATVFLTYAMSYRDYQTIQDIQNYMLYWTVTTFFYILALKVGIAHYGKGVHGWIK